MGRGATALECVLQLCTGSRRQENTWSAGVRPHPEGALRIGLGWQEMTGSINLLLDWRGDNVKPLSSEEREYIFSFVSWANRLPRRDALPLRDNARPTIKHTSASTESKSNGRGKEQRQRNTWRRLWWGLYGNMQHQWRRRPPCRKTWWGRRRWRWQWHQQRRQTTSRPSTRARGSCLTLHSTATQWRKHQLHESPTASTHCYGYQVLQQQYNSCQRPPVCSICSGVRGPEDTRHTTN